MLIMLFRHNEDLQFVHALNHVFIRCRW